MNTKSSEVPKWKSDEVKNVIDNIESNKVVAVINILGLPSRQFQEIRKSLRGRVKLHVSRLNLVRRAFESMPFKEGLLKLLEQVDGPTALAFTNENPFMLFKSLESTKQPAPAKEGIPSPIDIEVKKGNTNFKPGPIVGDLQRIGVPAVIEGGKVIIRENKVIVKVGDVFTRDVVEMLSRMDIMPLNVGLNLRAAYTDGTLFLPNDLYIDEAAYKSQISQATSQSFNLAIFAVYATKETIKSLLSKAAGETRSVAIDAAIPTTDLIKELLSIADARARGLKDMIQS